tara:strand:+ start:741 stop:953 length:213 start_codon:yes stop_codon:yes gene_type:complete
MLIQNPADPEAIAGANIRIQATGQTSQNEVVTRILPWGRSDGCFDGIGSRPGNPDRISHTLFFEGSTFDL